MNVEIAKTLHVLLSKPNVKHVNIANNIFSEEGFEYLVGIKAPAESNAELILSLHDDCQYEDDLKAYMKHREIIFDE